MKDKAPDFAFLNPELFCLPIVDGRSDSGFRADPQTMQWYTRLMNILLAAVLAITFFGSITPSPQLNRESSVFSTVALQLQNDSRNQASPSPRDQAPDTITSPTRVWRYVIIGSAVVILALIGVFAGFRFASRDRTRNMPRS